MDGVRELSLAISKTALDVRSAARAAEAAGSQVGRLQGAAKQTHEAVTAWRRRASLPRTGERSAYTGELRETSGSDWLVAEQFAGGRLDGWLSAVETARGALGAAREAGEALATWTHEAQACYGTMSAQLLDLGKWLEGIAADLPQALDSLSPAVRTARDVPAVTEQAEDDSASIEEQAAELYARHAALEQLMGELEEKTGSIPQSVSGLRLVLAYTYEDLLEAAAVIAALTEDLPKTVGEQPGTSA